MELHYNFTQLRQKYMFWNSKLVGTGWWGLATALQSTGWSKLSIFFFFCLIQSAALFHKLQWLCEHKSSASFYSSSTITLCRLSLPPPHISHPWNTVENKTTVKKRSNLKFSSIRSFLQKEGKICLGQAISAGRSLRAVFIFECLVLVRNVLWDRD